MNCKILKEWLKYKLGLSASLPVFVIHSIKEIENGEPLVNIRTKDAPLFFGGRLEKANKVCLRKSVAEKIFQAADLLPDGVFFLIYDAHRPLKVQQQEWERKYKYFQSLYPDETDTQIIQRTRRLVAYPYNGHHSGHQTGGAIDISLCDEHGVEIDMGTTYLSTDKKVITKTKVNKTAQNNRKLLCNVMKKVGFINYPNEWWHFCYGDRMWAAYSGKKNCFYGMVE